MKNKLAKILAVAMTVILLACAIPAIVSADAVTVSSVEINDLVPLNTAYTEMELYKAPGNSFCLAPVEAGYVVDPANSTLCYYVPNAGNWQGSSRDIPLDVETIYGARLTLELKSGYDWPAGMKTNENPDFTGFTLTVDGQATSMLDVEEFYYNDYWNTISFIIPIGLPSTEPCVKNVAVTPDRKALEKGGSFTFAAEVFGTASHTVEWSVIGAESNDTTVTNEGTLTVGADETAATFTVRATATADNTKYDEATVTVTDEAPYVTLGTLNSCQAYIGSTVNFWISRSGTEADKTVTWELTGNNSANTTLISSGYEYADASLLIGRDETAETLTITVSSVHHPDVSASCTVTVQQPERVSDIRLSLNTEDAALNTDLTECEMNALIVDLLRVDDIMQEQIYIDALYLSTLEGNSWFAVNGSDDPVDLEKTYGISVILETCQGYDWPSSVWDGIFTGMTFYLNGTEMTVTEYSYNEYWNSINLIFCPTLVDAEFTGASLSLGQDLSLNYFVSLHNADILTLGKPAIRFTFNGNSTLVTAYYVNAKGEYVFKFSGIAPQQMMDTLDAELLLLGPADEELEVLDVKNGYSVKQYFLDLDYNGNEPLQKLVEATAIYGLYAQLVTEYNTENLIGNDLIPNAEEPGAEEAMLKTGNETESCKILTAGVRFGSLNTIFVKIYAEGDFTLTVDNNVTYTNADCEDLGDNVYKLMLSPLAASELGKRYTFVLNDGNADVTTLEFGAFAYVKAVCDNAGQYSDYQYMLALSLYHYGLAATAYQAAQK